MGPGEARRKNKSGGTRELPPFQLPSFPCRFSGRTIQRSRRPEGTCRSIRRHSDNVKSWLFPDLPRAEGSHRRLTARSRRSRRGGWSLPPTACTARLSKPTFMPAPNLAKDVRSRASSSSSSRTSTAARASPPSRPALRSPAGPDRCRLDRPRRAGRAAARSADRHWTDPRSRANSPALRAWRSTTRARAAGSNGRSRRSAYLLLNERTAIPAMVPVKAPLPRAIRRACHRLPPGRRHGVEPRGDAG